MRVGAIGAACVLGIVLVVAQTEIKDFKPATDATTLR
jgi:hypothetical protein